MKEETQVSLNLVDNVETFAHDIQSGHWDKVLQDIALMQLPEKRVVDLYEQVVLELLEAAEFDTARQLLRGTDAMHALRRDHPDRYLRLEHMVTQQAFDLAKAYPDGISKDKRRALLARALAREVRAAAPSRLLTLLNQAIRWQMHQGHIRPGAEYDIFAGKEKFEEQDHEMPVKKAQRSIRFGSKSHPECALFTPDGQSLVSGSSDGFIEVWDFTTGKLRNDLEYQREDKLMMHSNPVLAMAVSRDTELLATGDQKGRIKVWRIKTGKCLRKFDGAHTGGITSLSFSRDATQVLSSSFDTTARVHGLKSGRSIKEFRGHSSYVNCARFTVDAQFVVTASSDGTVKVWDSKTADCARTFRPPQPNTATEVAVLSVAPLPGETEQLVVCCRTAAAYLTTIRGDVVKTFDTEANDTVVGAEISPRGDLLYLRSERGTVYCFSVKTAEIVHKIDQAHQQEVLVLAHHPHQSLVASGSGDSGITLWSP